MRLKPYVIRLYVAALAFFVINKLVLRTFVLALEAPAALDIFVLSVPNTIEAIVGTINVTALFTLAQQRLSPRFDGLSRLALTALGTSIAATYVITQELKIHNLGGRNVYDPYDLAASVIGLIATFLILNRWGLLSDGEGELPSSILRSSVGKPRD